VTLLDGTPDAAEYADPRALPGSCRRARMYADLSTHDDLELVRRLHGRGDGRDVEIVMPFRWLLVAE
jgi:hypothetical protein